MDSFEAARTIITRLQEAGHVALLAGGCVRDRLLGLAPKDHDVATDAPPQRVCALFRRTRQVGAQFGVVLVTVQGCDVEVATFRTDGDYHDGRRPDNVIFATAEEDARRRDFTINGMFYDPLAGRLVDYVGGREDLAACVVRCIGEPHQRFAEDHLRLLRAIRFATRLEFEIDADTFGAMRELAGRIEIISAERVRMELEMILADPRRGRGWRLICDAGLTNHLVRRVTWDNTQAARTGHMLAALPDAARLETVFAAMFANLAPKAAAKACRALRSSNEITRAVEYVIAQVPTALADQPPELADLKFLLASGRFEDVVMLARALASADGMNAAPVDALCRRAEAIAPEAIAPPPLFGGDDLLALKVPAGPVYARVLDAVYRAQLNEAIRTAGEARDLAMDLLQRGA